MALLTALLALFRGRARSVVPAVLLSIFPIVSAHADVPSAVVVQESNGFPGGEQSTQLSRQQVVFREGRLRVFDPRHLWALYVSLPDSVVQEASLGSQEYVERPFSYYEKYRQDRTRSLEAQTTEYERLVKRVEDPKELRQLRDDYTKMGGDPEDPGRLVAKLQAFPQDNRQVSILVDREQRELTLEHYVIRENQKEVPAFDLWVTQDVELPVDLLDFYRQLVPFGPEVNEQLAKIKGTLIECVASVDTGTFHRTFRSKVLEIRLKQQVYDADLRMPPGWQKLEGQGKPKTASKETVTCSLDGRQVPRKQARGYRDPRDGRRYWVCNSEERRKLIQMLAKGQRPPHDEGGGS